MFKHNYYFIKNRDLKMPLDGSKSLSPISKVIGLTSQKPLDSFLGKA